MIYRFLFRRLLLRLDAERAHRLGTRALAAIGRLPAAGAVLRLILSPRDPRLEVKALGLTFASPIGVAAGLDKEAECFAELGDLGFGHVEVGTVTARAQAGNAKPRVGRLPRDRALYNRMGFPNPGAEAFARRLAGRSRDVVVGVNVGKSMDVELADAAADYRETVRVLAPLADYLVINVSSPNTPGLRSMQSVDELRVLVDAVRDELREARVATPLLVKIAPDLSDDEIDAIADYAVETGLDGLVAVNTTIDGAVLENSTAEERAAVYGGISGAPLKRRALEVLHRLRDRAGDDLVLISVGGIESADDALERLEAGATLVQAYTGFVYGGPLWPRRVNKQLARRAASSA
ncbi:MAG TPA: quinone-dependent dihydroorotate dehydrogenase [Thermoleophilaceae bacterium]|nr:quinone-dependent dihydroorotate dehydrogenase [Thermoleophilaceae bacterium]